MNRTTESCARFIPPEIISHLWRITELYGAAPCVFILSSRRLGDRKVQDIRLDIDGFSFHHTIFGLPPVDWTVRVRLDGGDLVMALVLSEQARRELDRWAHIKSALTLRLKTGKTTEPHDTYLNKAG